MNKLVPHWTCPNCETSLETPFCPVCGERPLPRRDLTWRGVAGKVLHATTTIDGQLLRSFKLLLLRPGFLTVAYMEGRRTPYLAPFKLFLAANALFFAITSLTGINVFSSSLDSHLHHQDWSAFAQSIVARHLADKHLALADYAPVFDRSVVLYAKSLIVLMVLPFAALVAAIHAGSRKPLMTHVAFALHLYAFLLLLFCASILLARLDEWLGGGGLAEAWMDNTVSIFNLLACGLYLYLAAKPVFGAQRWSGVARASVLAVLAALVVMGYRFALLLITLAAT